MTEPVNLKKLTPSQSNITCHGELIPGEIINPFKGFANEVSIETPGKRVLKRNYLDGVSLHIRENQ